MTKPTTYAKRALIGITVFLQVVFYPAAALAEEIIPPADNLTGTSETAPANTTATTGTSSNDDAIKEQASTVTTPPPPPAPAVVPPPTGITQPSGADSTTYVKNPNGTWSNDTYTWDPVTGKTTPNTPQEYSFNPVTGVWDTTEYRYDAPSGKYVPNVVSVSSIPSSRQSAPVSPSSTSSGISLTGPGSTNLANSNSTGNGFFSGFFNARITNNINSTSRSGDAGVVQNTIGGDALSGNADAMATILSLLQSSWDPSAGGPQTFVANINGDVNGDLTIDPSLISATGPGSLNATNSTANNNLKVVAQDNGAILNNVDLDATSGNANVSGNTDGGDATTGDANAVANLINLINSSINAGQSFVGVLNINGNFNGDVLLAPWLLKALLADTGPGSTNTSNQTVNNSLNANVSDNQAINNNVGTTATTGSASVDGNTNAGTASSGTATTNVTLLNLTGREVIAKDAMLVFVNVFGKWVGLIMNAPSGSTSALIGGTGPGSSNTASGTTNNNASLTSDSNSLINNDINVKARSGDASVSGNTLGGNASSGNANAGVNVANLINTKLNISDWFGVLFINVFGNWNGSFGVDTPFGNPVVNKSTTTSAANSATSTAGSSASPAQAAANVFGFIPRTAGSGNGGSTNSNVNDTQVLAATTDNEAGQTDAKTSPITTASAVSSPIFAITEQARANWTWTIAGMSTAITLLGLERYLSLRRRI